MPPRGSSILASLAGRNYKADLNNPVFDLGSKMGLVGIVHDVRYAVGSEGDRIRAVANKSLFTAGYLPKRLAAVVTPLLWPGGAANTTVIETASRGGARAWPEDHRHGGA